MSIEGVVYLVGAGPGDPSLLTLRGRECLQEADCVIYDHLVSGELLSYARAGAELVYVGKKAGRHELSQEEINRLLVARAREGKKVVRLKGGDPFIFGRGGEEAEELAASGVPFEVVPGVSAGHGVPAYAGIPLTHRAYASSVAFITGHEDPSKELSTIAWDKIVGVDTLVFFMATRNIEAIARTLIEHGRDRATPAAVISQGTNPEQVTVVGRLDRIAELAEKARISPPALTVVGEVVRLRERLAWFERRPLFGRRIMVTRARRQSGALSDRLRRLGAAVFEFPTIEIVPPSDYGSLDRAAARAGQFDWIIFTSANGVACFIDRLWAQGRDLRDLKGPRLAAIGPATAESLERLRLRVEAMPEEYRAEAVVDALARAAGGRDKLKGLRILLPRAKMARDVLPDELRRLGAEVEVVEAYRTILPEAPRGEAAALLERGEIHGIIFTSTSTVVNFAEMFKDRDLAALVGKAAVICIGPITAEAAARCGLQPSIIPRQYTIPGLIEALLQSELAKREPKKRS